MPRALFVPTDDPYHVSARCINKEWFSSPMDEIWDIFSSQLYLTQKAFDLKIHSFVLMSNHFHLILTAPQLNLSSAMNYFLRESSKQILKSSCRINRTFSDRFFRSRIQGYHHFTTVYKYVYRNPIEANMCRFVEEYPWSTLNGLFGLSKLLIPLEEDTLLFESDIEATLKWLNTKPDPENREVIRKALRRREFSLPKVNKFNHPLTTQSY